MRKRMCKKNIIIYELNMFYYFSETDIVNKPIMVENTTNPYKNISEID